MSKISEEGFASYSVSVGCRRESWKRLRVYCTVHRFGNNSGLLRRKDAHTSQRGLMVVDFRRWADLLPPYTPSNFPPNGNKLSTLASPFFNTTFPSTPNRLSSQPWALERLHPASNSTSLASTILKLHQKKLHPAPSCPHTHQGRLCCLAFQFARDGPSQAPPWKTQLFSLPRFSFHYFPSPRLVGNSPLPSPLRPMT